MNAELRRFLELCLRARHDGAAWMEVRARAERDRLNWNRLVAAAVRQRVAPLLYSTLRDASFVPRAARQRLQRAYLINAHHNVVLLHETEAVVADLERAGVPTIVLKGAALIQSVYGHIAMRPLMDVDLLIRREHLAAALGVVAAHGFAPHRPETRAGAAAAFENELLLIKPGHVPVPLEIHWSLFDSPYYQQRLDLDFCWRTAVPLRLGQTATRMLGPEAQLLHLCGHLVLHHGGDDLLWEEDIAAFVRLYGKDLDWRSLCARAVEFDLVIPLQRLLLEPVEGPAIVIPPAALDQLRGLRPSMDEVRIVAYLTAEKRSVAQRFWSDLASTSSWRQRVAYAWTHLVPSAAYMGARYQIVHPLLLPFYYPYRWLRGLRGRD